MALDNSQALAAYTRSGHTLVLAGPGSGKTRVLVERVAFLVHQVVEEPFRVLAVTFTDKASDEMLHRLRKRIPSALDRVQVGTFHSFGAGVLRSYISYLNLGLNPDFSILDTDEQRTIMDGVLDSAGLRSALPTWRALQAVAGFKESGCYPARDDSSVQAQAYRLYQDILQSSNCLDYSDLLAYVRDLFVERPEILRMYRTAYPQILIDEFQDTNNVQYEILKLLVPAGGSNGSLFAVADGDQLIYSWRGANPQTLDTFVNDYDATVIDLTVNYRCPKKVVDLASHLISQSSRRLSSAAMPEVAREEQGVILGHVAPNEFEEARTIMEFIQERTSAGQGLSDIAVIARARWVLNEVAHSLEASGIPYHVVGSERYETTPEVVLCLSLCHMSLGTSQMAEASARESVEELGLLGDDLEDDDRSLHWLESLISAVKGLQHKDDLDGHGRFERVLSELDVGQILLGVGLTETDRDRRSQNFTLFVQAATEALVLHGGNLGAALAQLEHANSVSLMTVHAAKGTEFNTVVIVGLENGLFPDNRSHRDEELRLLYVACTRSMSCLLLTRCSHRSQRGRERSPFLASLPDGLIDRYRPAGLN